MISNTFHPLSFSQLLDCPPRKWLVKNLIGPQDLVMVYAQPGLGKTLMVIDFLFAAAMGATWAEKFRFSRPLSVAYCSNEGRSGLPYRFKAAAQQHNIDESSRRQLEQRLTIYLDVPQLYSALSSPSNSFEVSERQLEINMADS